jgi:hypothetical protein
MVALENPEENPCFGCGPRHPRGLRLRFDLLRAPDGSKEVSTEFTPQADEIGWPGLFHHGLHFLTLYEASYWEALEAAGHLMVHEGPTTYTSVRLPRVGVRHIAVARVLAREGERLKIRASSATVEGKPCGTLETDWRPAVRAQIERAGIVLPGYLTAELRD